MSKSSKLTTTLDAEQMQSAADLLESIQLAKRGECALVHTPEVIAARRGGRPVGSAKTSIKRPTTLRLDDAVLARWCASGKGWQTRVALVLAANAPPV